MGPDHIEHVVRVDEPARFVEACHDAVGSELGVEIDEGELHRVSGFLSGTRYSRFASVQLARTVHIPSLEGLISRRQ